MKGKINSRSALTSGYFKTFIFLAGSFNRDHEFSIKFQVVKPTLLLYKNFKLRVSNYFYATFIEDNLTFVL